MLTFSNLNNMMNNYLLVSLFVFLMCPEARAEKTTMIRDSIGIEKKQGKTFILHKVDPKETLFSLSKKYQVEIEDIVKHNPESRTSLRIASVLKIPVTAELENTSAASSQVVHTVAPSETLFSISKQYQIDVNDLIIWNNLSGNDIKIGQKLIIHPNQPQEINSGLTHNNRVPAQTEKPRDPDSNYHTVQPGQTLFAISRQYEVSQADIRKWNNLNGNNLDVGQELVVGKKADKTPQTRNQKPANSTNSDNESSEKDQAIARSNEPVASTRPVNTYKIEDSEYKNRKKKAGRKENTDIKKVTENGLAEVIEGSGDTKKYLALHRSAPIGTIMQVKNEMNNLRVFVRVIGKLPDTGDNNNLEIKISKVAYDRLGAIDNRFPVEISYIPQ